MTPQEISTIMRGLGRIEGRLKGLESEVHEHSDQLADLLTAAAKVQGVAESRATHRGVLLAYAGLAVGLIGTASAFAGYLVRHFIG